MAKTSPGGLRAAQRRAAQRGAQQRRRLLLVGVAVLAVLAVLAAIIVVAAGGGGKTTKPAERSLASAAVVSAATSVPPTTLARVGRGTAGVLPRAISGTPLTADGKPLVLYVGGEYCPYCAAERWAMVVALSRFGTFSGLGQTTSSSRDVFPNTPTFSFHGARYTSDYLSFRGKEIYSNRAEGDGYAPLDILSADEQRPFEAYSGGAFPFVDLGNRYVVTGAQYDPQVLADKTMTSIADELANPDSAVAEAIDGSANTLTAALCRLTGNTPRTVCSTGWMAAIQSELGGR